MDLVAATGNDTLILDGRVLTGFADGDVITLEFPNDVANVKTGKNNNTIYSLNETGKNADLTIKLIRGCADDKHFNQRLNNQNANFPGTVLFSGSLIKKIGDGKGNILNDTYVLSGGVIKKMVVAKSNVEGDVEQSTVSYVFSFSSAVRAIG
jgi:hypothetical protein